MPITVVSPFTALVLKTIQKIPFGKVATYKQIACLCDKPQGSRAVSWILHSCSTKYKLPWHRVINSGGRISFEPKTYNFREQKRRLQAEGIVVSSEGSLELKKFQWKKSPLVSKSKKGTPSIFSRSF